MIGVIKWILVVFFGIFLGLVGFAIFRPSDFNPQPSDTSAHGPIFAFDPTPIMDVQKYDINKPEDIALDSENGVFYSGLADGRIVQVDIKSGDTKTILNPSDFNPKLLDKHSDDYCNGSPFRSSLCGMVLGIKLRGKELLMMNKVFGIFLYNLETKKLEKIVDNDKTAEGGILEFYDDGCFGKDEFKNKIYYSFVSKKWSYKGMFNTIYEFTALGKVMEFDLITKKVEVVMDGFFFPNGVLTVGKYLFVTDTSAGTLTKFDLETRKKVFENRISIYPDNLSFDPDSGKIYIAGTERSRFMEFVTSHPCLVKIIAIHPISLALATLKLMNFHTGIILEVSLDGEISRAIFNKGDDFKGLTSVYRSGEDFFVGSFLHEQAVRFRLEK